MERNKITKKNIITYILTFIKRDAIFLFRESNNSFLSV